MASSRPWQAVGLGFDIVYPLPDKPALSKGPPKYEIVAIPGIGIGEDWSWKLNKVNWLRDTSMLAQKIPDARISIFNYTPDGFDKGPDDEDANKLLWAHGKAATGQAAVASSAINFLKGNHEAGSIVASFYCDQSEKQRRSLVGLLQIIIYQVIEANPDLAVHLLSDSKKGKQQFDPEASLKVQVLWDALLAMAKHITGGSIYIIIFGLEQLADDALDTFFEHMEELADAPLMQEGYEIVPIKWMLLSRTGRPKIVKFLKSKSSEIDLEDEQNLILVSNDLRAQISVSVDSLRLPSSLAYFVKTHIQSRAEDNEIYMKLVIQELRNAWEGRNTRIFASYSSPFHTD
ncbi:hypothetical protein ACEQ8H_005122 [Pleosporales sp. CAS-2024a]